MVWAETGGGKNFLKNFDKKLEKALRRGCFPALRGHKGLFGFARIGKKGRKMQNKEKYMYILYIKCRGENHTSSSRPKYICSQMPFSERHSTICSPSKRSTVMVPTILM